MGKGLLKWLAALGTGAATTVLAYIVAHLGSPTDPIAGVDPIVTFVAVSGLTKLVTWLTSLMGAPKPPVTTSGNTRGF